MLSFSKTYAHGDMDQNVKTAHPYNQFTERSKSNRTSPRTSYDKISLLIY